METNHFWERIAIGLMVVGASLTFIVWFPLWLLGFLFEKCGGSNER